jgi:recombination protein RecT
MTTTTTTAAPTKAITKTDQQRMTLRRLFENQKPELAKLLPRGMDADRLYRLALTECVKNPDLLKCTAESWALAMQRCAAEGLYPDSGLGFMWLIPREKKRGSGIFECHAQRGYQGDMQLVRNTGEVTKITAEVVHEKDEFRVTLGLDPNIHHVPYDGDDDPGALRATYAVAKLANGEVQFSALKKRDIDRHKRSAQGLDRSDSPWNLHTEEMWKKTAIRALVKYLPKSSEKMQRAAAQILGEGAPAIETTAIDLGSVALPMEDKRPALDALVDQITESTTIAGLDEVGVQGPCPHPAIPPSRLKPGQILVCPDCSEDVRGPAVAQ